MRQNGISSFCSLWASLALKWSCTSSWQGADMRVPLLQQAAAILCVQQQSLSESQPSSAGLFLPATDLNPRSKIVQNTVLPPSSSPYASGASLEYFILMCVSIFHSIAFLIKCLSLMNMWNTLLLWISPQSNVCCDATRSHLHSGTAGVLWQPEWKVEIFVKNFQMILESLNSEIAVSLAYHFFYT